MSRTQPQGFLKLQRRQRAFSQARKRRAQRDMSLDMAGLVLPKRLRTLMSRTPELAGEASRILARELELHHRRKLGGGSPAQLHFISSGRP